MKDGLSVKGEAAVSRLMWEVNFVVDEMGLAVFDRKGRGFVSNGINFLAKKRIEGDVLDLVG